MRPIVHFTARSGWINDPHGITWRDGQYHAFYQYVPDQTVWGPNCHWGHAVGPDLLSLTELPVALAPGEGDDGIWTGSLVQDADGDTVVFYTATTTPNFGIGRVRRATPNDEEWVSWTKGPVVAEAPPELDIIAYRDPFVRREGDTWRMFLGAALRDGTATALSYTSGDLQTWNYEGIALQRSTIETDGVWMGALWECPQVFEIDGQSVMISSVWDDDVLHYAGYAIGDYTEGLFVANTWGRLTYGTSYYAPSLFHDADGRPCLLLWMRGPGGGDEDWASAHSVPHVLSLRDGRLAATPHPDVAAHHTGANADRVTARAADIVWSGATVGVLTVSDGQRSFLWVVRDGNDVTIEVDGSSTHMPVSGDVRIILDGPVLEISSAGPIFGGAVDTYAPSLSITATSGRVNSHNLS